MAAVTGALAACSMAGPMQRNALDYNSSVANYNDQMLVYTILRARDEAPINILALSTINGSVSMQAGLGATSTYQHFGGLSTDPEVNFAQAVAPTVTTSSSPAWSMASLNTQAFTLGIIQPISPMYVVSKWSGGIDREFLLRLFIKSISIKQARGYHEYLNDPNSPADMAEFGQLLKSWFPKVRMRSLTVLEPVGPPFDPTSVTSVSTSWDARSRDPVKTRVEKTEGTNTTSESLIDAYHYLIPLDNGLFHVGNAAPAPNGALRLQLYREYPQQVVLCVPRATLRPQAMSDDAAPLGPSEDETREEESAMSAYALALKSAARGGAGRVAEAQPASAAGANVPGPLAAQGVTKPSGSGSIGSNLKVDRVAAVLPIGACGQDQLVLPVYTEEENARNAGTYSHVEWRSISEVIEYLGALLRAGNAAAGEWQTQDGAGHATRHTLFALSERGEGGFTQVAYRGASYAIRTDSDGAAPDTRNHSMQALRLLNELISAAKVSSDIPNTQAIQIVP